jgi:predicted negative regulator of RcsB-dependent stress response
MKNTSHSLRLAKIDSLAEFRIDFDAAAALIGLPNFRPVPVMPADLPEPPMPLAEISQGPNAFEEFLDRNQKNLVILAILLAIGAAALVIYRGIEKSRMETAGAALNKAEDLAALQAVVNEHAGTTAALSAMVLLADRQWSDGQQDAAIETLRAFISSSPSHPARPAAQASLASKLMAQGKSAAAATIFEDVGADPSARFIAPYALISLGDISKVAGDLEKAEASYKRVKTEFPDSSFAAIANRRIAILKAKPPVEIEPPPAPEPKSDTPPASLIPPVPGGVVPVPVAPPAPAPAPAPAPPAPPAPPAEATPPAPPQEAPPQPRNEQPGETPAAPEP